MELPNRKSIRLKDYDYSSSEAYFVTICAQNREQIFGNIVNGKMITNYLGNLVIQQWELLSDRFPVIIDTYQTMPNHFHGILVIDNPVGAGLVPALGLGRPQGSPLRKITLGNIIGAFKSLSTNTWAQGKIWQRNYYEHVIRNKKDYSEISQYIINNPLLWDRDRNNPEAKKDLIPW